MHEVEAPLNVLRLCVWDDAAAESRRRGQWAAMMRAWERGRQSKQLHSILRYAARGLRHSQYIMEGFLIRLPLSAWDVDERSSNARGSVAVKAKRQRTSVRKSQAKLMYYVLGEGYLEAFASPDGVEPLESFRLTSFQVEVKPVYSMLMFRVTTSPKRSLQLSAPIVQARNSKSPSSSEEDESNGESSTLHTSEQDGAAEGSSLLLFTGDRVLVDKWCSKLLNWNRYVFAGGAPIDNGSVDDVKRKLIAAFIDKSTRGMFTSSCDLVDCTGIQDSTEEVPSELRRDATATGAATTAPLSTAATTAITKPSPTDVSKPGAAPADIKPLWMLLNRSTSRRISAVSFHKLQYRYLNIPIQAIPLFRATHKSATIHTMKTQLVRRHAHIRLIC